MKKVLLLLPLLLTLLSCPVYAFTGNPEHTQTLIVTSRVIKDDGAMVDPDGGAKENEDKFQMTVQFRHLLPGDSITWYGGTIFPKADGTAEVTYETSNCDPMYFDGVPTSARFRVTEEANKYVPSYETQDIAPEAKGSTSESEASLTTQELSLSDGKDGLVLFSNRKAKDTCSDHPVRVGIVVLCLLSGGAVLAMGGRIKES